MIEQSSVAYKCDDECREKGGCSGHCAETPDRDAARKRGRLIDVYRQLRHEYGFGRFSALIELLDWL